MLGRAHSELRNSELTFVRSRLSSRIRGSNIVILNFPLLLCLGKLCAIFSSLIPLQEFPQSLTYFHYLSTSLPSITRVEGFPLNSPASIISSTFSLIVFGISEICVANGLPATLTDVVINGTPDF